MATGSHFDQVISAIDDMISNLKGEEETDLEIKDQIKANKDEIKSLNEELDQATKDREDEHTLWSANNADDKAAADLVESAKGVLEDFYKDNDLMFLQNEKMDPVVAGEAPPPPPPTWEAPYGGKTGESQGIVAILEMIHEDIIKDQTKGKADEDKAEETFQAFKTNSEQQISTLEGANTDLEDTKGEKEDDISTAKEQRGAKHDELNAVVAKINDAAPSCIYTTINYPVRLKNRQVEIDGLEKAKAILQGGEFPSLLQRK